jgi:predicted esterase
VLLHGYEDDPASLFALSALLDPADASVVLAPRAPVTTPKGPAWFESHDADRGPALPDTLDALAGLARERAYEHGVDESAVAVLGYSQGAATALALAFRAGASWRPAFVAGHAAWLPNEPGIDWDFEGAGDVRVMLTHGIDDDVVDVQQGRGAMRVLERAGVDVTFVEIEAGHELDALPVSAIAARLQG